MKSKNAVILLIICLVGAMAAIFIFSWFPGSASAGHFNNGNVSFEYPTSMQLVNNTTSTTNSTTNITVTDVCKLVSPSPRYAIIVRQIPISVRTVTLAATENGTGNSSGNTTPTPSNQTSSNSSKSDSNPQTITFDTFQSFLEQMTKKYGEPKTTTKNGYNYYEWGPTDQNNYITAIIKDNMDMFFLIVYQMTNETQSGSAGETGYNAYRQVVDTFRILIS